MGKCAVNGCDMTDVHKHHIDPVVYDPHGNGRKRKNLKMTPTFDPNKKLGESSFTEIFSYMFTLGCMSEKETITLCTYHHNIMHGIMKFQKAQHSNLIKEGVKRAKERGVRMGRPPSVTDEKKNQICDMYKSGVKKKNIAKKLRVGCGTVYDTLRKNNLLVEENGRPI